MLIFGEAAIPGTDKKSINTIEVLIKNKYKQKFIKDFNLKKSYVLIGENISLHAHNKTNKHFILYGVDTEFQPNRILKSSFSDSKINIAPILINHALLWTSVNYRYSNVNIWIRRMELMRRLEFLKNALVKDESTIKKYYHIGKYMAINIHRKLDSIIEDNHTPMPYEIVSKPVLMSIVTQEKAYIKSSSKVFGHAKDLYYEGLFNEFTNLEKYNAIRDLIYMQCINEYFICEKALNNKFPPKEKWRELFLTTIMDIYTRDVEETDFIKNYIFNNLNKIIDNYTEKPFNDFLSYVKIKNLKIEL